MHSGTQPRRRRTQSVFSMAAHLEVSNRDHYGSGIGSSTGSVDGEGARLLMHDESSSKSRFDGKGRGSDGPSEEYEMEYDSIHVAEDSLLSNSQSGEAPRRRVLKAGWTLTKFFVLWLRAHWYIPLAVFILLPLALYIILSMTPLSYTEALLPPMIKEARQVLIAVAHPDDECLFFSPSVRNILDRANNASGNILVMSAGNNYGLGEQRKLELQGSCIALGVPIDRCQDLDMPAIQDDPVKWWPETEVGPVIQEFVNKWDIDLVITFDEGGVSGHINHRAVGSAVRYLVASNATFPPSYKSITVNVLRKYSGLLDTIPTSLSFLPRLLQSLVPGIHPSQDRALLVSNPWNYFRARAAFASHQSQYVWDRHIYVIISRYMVTNDLERIKP